MNGSEEITWDELEPTLNLSQSVWDEEEKRAGNKKQPHYFQMKDERLFGFAGLWEHWSTPDGESLETCSILTIGANEVLSTIHERMPVILHPDDYALWLDEDVTKQDLRKELLRPFPASEMIGSPVDIPSKSGQKGASRAERPSEAR